MFRSASALLLSLLLASLPGNACDTKSTLEQIAALGCCSTGDGDEPFVRHVLQHFNNSDSQNALFCVAESATAKESDRGDALAVLGVFQVVTPGSVSVDRLCRLILHLPSEGDVNKTILIASNAFMVIARQRSQRPSASYANF